jgi:hypothetical protein
MNRSQEGSQEELADSRHSQDGRQGEVAEVRRDRGRPAGFTMTEEQKAKIADALRGRRLGAEHRAKIAAALRSGGAIKLAWAEGRMEVKPGSKPRGYPKGRPQSAESNRKRSEVLRGRRLADGHRRKISRGLYRYHARREADDRL